VSIGASVVRDSEARETTYAMPRSQLLRVAQQLAAEGWWVEVEGHAFHLPSGVEARVTSGIDWFDLHGVVHYGALSAALADVLDAHRRGTNVVVLADGSRGLLPHDWLDRLGPVLAGGQSTPIGARFRSSQLALLDALLDGLPGVAVDEQFAQAREQLAGFARITPADPPSSFVGTLRGYQRDGLGWLHFLRTFGFGGCLADDMGLGKTVQVLALLETRRRDRCGPSLVVVPRSLVFNWRAEAARFAPALRTLDWSGAERHDATLDPEQVDVVFATYGTLRRDAAQLAKTHFDYVVLDEAQAIKNRGTATAKACRLLTARHRLALSGTPVENRLEELWSLLDFLNPGMLGTSARFSASLRDAAGVAGAEATLARALRPVILRRTKAQVAPDLPERIERTLEVELEPKQRVFYDQLHARVRDSVMQQVEEHGLGRSRLHILEGLLRLRQAACHPVLADARRRTLPSAKLEALVPALADVAAEGHKALVFSQFTEFLALLRTALDAEQIPYEYLDGRTRDRQSRVERFQHDPKVPLFLISLKAGGHGLNLTAADYVYLLDPWWNPAVEAQAIDRAHRIGRTRRVIATRLVARNTIEEKILALQASKRALADAILSTDRGGLAAIGREELELLLG
jgi:SNF2 family DNA or RNA helicase